MRPNTSLLTGAAGHTVPGVNATRWMFVTALFVLTVLVGVLAPVVLLVPVLLLALLAPVALLFAVIYGATRLAIRHERRVEHRGQVA